MIFKSKGILGINARNLLYIKPYNAKKAIRLADDKIKTKQFLSARGIPVPKLFSVIKDTAELEKFDFNSLPAQFVLKPNQGFGGEGIIPVWGKKEGLYITPGGRRVSRQDLKDQIQDILDGRYSISNVSDSAFFEQLIISDQRIGKYSFEGLPDIRVVVHNLIPVMAMLRLPTKESHGKANLHQGAVGVGIDIAKGQCTNITYKNRIIEELPDSLGKVRGVKIPYWNDILMIASKVQLTTNLGYMAADICLDKNIGPVLLEINARAGLGVQIANLAPLRKRLERIEGIKVTTPQKGVRMAKDLFGNVVEKEIEQLSGKQIVGTEEKVEIIQKQGNFRLPAKIDTSRDISVLDEETAAAHGLLVNEENYDDEKSTLKLKFTLKDRRIQTIVEIEKIASEKHKMILGNRDLKDFLIDTGAETKKTPQKNHVLPVTNLTPKPGLNFSEIDQELVNLDSKIKLLYHLRPINLEEEKIKFLANPKQNPQFEYPRLKFDPLELIDRLNKIITDGSPLGQIFDEKKKEIALKIKLLESIDEVDFSETSIELFGKPSPAEIKQCQDLLKKLSADKTSGSEKMHTSEEAKEKFNSTFAKYGLNNWEVQIKKDMVSDCVAGKNNRLFVRKNALFSATRIESLITHEIETHILTAENGKLQPYGIFNRGLANYLQTQEGLAVYNVEQQQHLPFIENSKALGHVLAINAALQTSFAEVFELLRSLNFSTEQAFRAALKAKRGYMDTGKRGAFTKDYIYFRGYNEIREFVEKGGKIRDLYIGKMALKDLEKVKKISGIREPVILPVWLK